MALVEEHKIRYEGAKGVPHVREIGNAVRKFTGAWRVFRPMTDYKKCISCKICFTFCPDSAIRWVKNRPVFDWQVCKGCGICSAECPVRCIAMQRESKFSKK